MGYVDTNHYPTHDERLDDEIARKHRSEYHMARSRGEYMANNLKGAQDHLDEARRLARQAHTDTCNGDHSDVSGRCGEDPLE